MLLKINKRLDFEQIIYITYARKPWSLTKGDERKLMISRDKYSGTSMGHNSTNKQIDMKEEETRNYKNCTTDLIF